MRRISRIERRRLLTGWIKWALLPALPFCVLFFDAWLNIQVRYKDYELNQLNVERRQLNEELDMARTREASLSGVDHLTVMAEKLALSPPRSQPFTTIAYREVPRRIPVMNLAQVQSGSSRPEFVNFVSPMPNAPTSESIPYPHGAPLLAPLTPPEETITLGATSPGTPAAPAEQNKSESMQPYSNASYIYEDTDMSLLTVEDMLTSL